MHQNPSWLEHETQRISQEILRCSDEFVIFTPDEVGEIIGVESDEQGLKLPLMGVSIQAGFPSPADDYIEQKLDLNQFLISHPAATYFVRVVGNSMTGAHIQENDYLVVDRAIAPTHNAIVIAMVERELTVKRLYRRNGVIELRADNPTYPPISITGEMELYIWGVVCGVFRKTV